MAWTKYFKSFNNTSPISGNFVDTSTAPAYRNYQSQLPDVYTGHPNRIDRYNQYELMDIDSEVNGALDILAEFCTQEDDKTAEVFKIHFKEKPSDTEIKILKNNLSKWCSLNKLSQRLFKIFRNTIKYGDQIFIRDPETFEMYWVEMSKVLKVIVNENEGKKIEQYIIKDIGPNFSNLTATQINATDLYTSSPAAGSGSSYSQPRNPYGGGSRFTLSMNESAVSAEHVVHLSLSEGLDVNWPFGTSILESIYKVFKQKELLEDAIIIYRVQRAPERRIFYIDTGNMPSHMAMAFVERVKNEIHQRRIPTVTGGGSNMMDATYNPLSINEDYFFPQTAEGRGSKVDTLPGGSNLGEIDDLKYFTNKMFRGLRIPTSYLPTGPDDGTSTYNDGKVGTALIQEWRFNQYCKRLQQNLAEVLDKEFKLYLKWMGFNLDGSMFELKFNDPQNFAHYKLAELDTARIQSYTSLEQYPYFSKRFLMTRFLGLTEDEMQQNEEMWEEENADSANVEATANDLRSAGISGGSIAADVDTIDSALADIDAGEGGEETAGVPGATPPPAANQPGQQVSPD